VALKRASAAPTEAACGSGEDDARHGLVVGLLRLAEDVRGDDVALVLADVGQRPDAGDVADRPQALARTQLRVDRDPAAVGLDANGLQADPGNARAPAGGDEQAVAAQLAAILELEDVVLTLAPRRGGVDAKEQLDAVATQDFGHGFPQRCGLAGEDVLAALDERHHAAEAAHGLGHLDADRPPAQDEQASRDGLHASHLTVAPEALELPQPRDGRNERLGAVRDDDLFRGVAHAVDLDHARPGEPAGAAQQVDARTRQPALRACVGVVRDHEVTPGKRRLDVDLRTRRRIARGLHRLARAQQRLRRDARPIGALAPDQLPLHEADAQAAFRERGGAVLARRAAADDNDVVVAAHQRAPSM